MRTKTFTLANGFADDTGQRFVEAELRQLDGTDEDFLLDREELRKGRMLSRLLKRCITGLGGITDRAQIERLYDQHFLMADETSLLVDLRRWSMGDTYEFRWQCEGCGKTAARSINLSTLRFNRQREEDRFKATYVAGIDLPEIDFKAVVTFRMLRVKDTPLLDAIKEQYRAERGSRELLVQLVEWNGERVTTDDVRSMPWAARTHIRNVIDSHTGGYDIELTIPCLGCNNEDTAFMPIEARSFFYPKTGASRSTAVCRPASGTT